MLTEEMIRDMSGKERRSLRLQAGLSLADVGSMLKKKRGYVTVEGWEDESDPLPCNHLACLCEIYKYRPYTVT